MPDRHLTVIDLDGGDDIDLSPVLGEIARRWQGIHPGHLTAPEALRLLNVLCDIGDRLGEGSHAECNPR